MQARSKHPLFQIWSGMVDRCTNPRCKAWPDYGGRGIKVCERWMYFWNFVEDMGERPTPNHSLDRFPDNDGNYELHNCRWATRKEQMRNRRNTLFIEIEGDRYTVAELSEKSGLKADTIMIRAKTMSTLDELLSPEKRVFKEGLKLGGLANGARNRAKTHCKYGHEYTPENTMPNGPNGRTCRACHNARQRERNSKKREVANHQSSL
jgi:hypothetical protein